MAALFLTLLTGSVELPDGGWWPSVTSSFFYMIIGLRKKLVIGREVILSRKKTMLKRKNS